MKNEIYIYSAVIASVFIVTPTVDLAAATFWGVASCQEWIDSRKEEREKTNYSWVKASSHKRWIIGFLSGMSILDENQKSHVIKNIDIDVVADWTDSYCNKHQNDHIGDAAIELYIRLSNK